MPLQGKGQAFLYGVLSGAAGAMTYVVVELISEHQLENTVFTAGFTIMLALDIALG